MKILHIVHQYWPFRCGSSRYFQLPSEYFAAKGHNVTVLTTDALEHDYFINKSKRRAEKVSEIHNGVNIHRFRVRHLPREVLEYLHDYLPFHWAKCFFGFPFVPGLLLATMRKYDFDIVHGGILPYGILLYAAKEIARRNQIPLIMSPHLHIGEPENDHILKAHSNRYHIDMVRHCDLIFTQSNLEKEKLSTFGIPKSRIEVLGNGISLRELSGGNGGRFKRKYGIKNQIVAFLGTRAYDKGTVHLIEAAEVLWGRNKKFTLILAGSSSNQDFVNYYKNCSSTVKKNTLVLTDISEEEKNDLLASAEILAMPSRNEAFGVAYLEAWAYRKPVIGAIAGGVPDVISDGRDGFLVPFGDVHMLEHRIEILLKNRDLAKRMGEYGYDKLVSNFTIEEKFEILENAYEKLCSENKK